MGLTVTGNSTTDEQLIRINSGLKVGSALRGEDVQQAIRQLWSLKRFQSVEVVLQREVADGVYLEIQVVELPRLRGLEILGTDKLSKTRVREALKEVVAVGQPVGGLELFKTRRALMDL